MNTRTGLSDLKYRSLTWQDIEQLEQASNAIMRKIGDNQLNFKWYVNGLMASANGSQLFFVTDTQVDADNLNKWFIVNIHTFQADKTLKSLFSDEIQAVNAVSSKYL